MSTIAQIRVTRTRPLTLVDVSNRIVAAAYKYCWEPQLGTWISSAQRGFIPGRSMMANVVQLEHAAMATQRRVYKSVV